MFTSKIYKSSGRLLRLRLSSRYTTTQSPRVLSLFTKYAETSRIKCESNDLSFQTVYCSKRNIRLTPTYHALPPHTKIELPALSPTMETGTIANWVVKEGGSFETGDLLAEIETDKATVGFEAQDEGFIAKIFYAEGSKDIKLGTLIAISVENEENIAAFKDYVPGTGDTESSNVSSPAPVTKTTAPLADDLPRHERVTLPALSPTMTTGTIAKWSVNAGDKVEEGDLLAEIETDKATMAMEAEEEGYIAKILLPSGTKDIPLGTLLCIVVEHAEDVAKFENYVDSGSAPDTKPEAAAAITPLPTKVEDVAVPKLATPVKVDDRVFASPLARKLSNEKGYNLANITGSGPNNRVRAQDVLSFEPTEAPAAKTAVATKTPTSVADMAQDYIDIPMTKFREVTAQRLTESKQNIPHYYLTVDCAVDELLDMRKQFNNDLQKEGTKLSVNDFLIKAASLACLKVPEANSSWQDTFIRQYNTVDVSVAVSTDNGLITPIVFNADGKGLVSISQNVHSLATKAREGKLQPNEFIGGTFTISNLGMFGIKHFTAIINPPQACILAVGSSRKEFVPDENSETGMREANLMSVTLSCDHRVVDGAVGAKWLQHFKKFIEHPTTMLL